jgi:magnesium-protoporphyrin O-methyltransferase
VNCCYSGIGAAAKRQFGEKRAAKDLAQYRKNGPGATARLLLAAIEELGEPHLRLIDIGSGVGALTFELLRRGVPEAIGIDLSPAYVVVALEEATNRGHTNEVRFINGDFVSIAGQLPAAEIVTLDRVICCYPAYERLLSESLEHADGYLAISYPKDVWYVRRWVGVENLVRRLLRNPFRTFVHPALAMEDIICGAGFELASRRHTGTWNADVYRRVRPAHS